MYLLVERRLPCASEAVVETQHFPVHAASTAGRLLRLRFPPLRTRPSAQRGIYFLRNVVLNNQLGTFCNIGGIAAKELCIIRSSIAIAGELKLQAELAVPSQVDKSTGL